MHFRLHFFILKARPASVCRARSIVDLRVRSLGFLKGADGYAVP